MKTNKILILFALLGFIGCSDSSRFSFPDTPDPANPEITPPAPTPPPGDPAPDPDGSGNTGGTDGAGAAALCQDADSHVNVYVQLRDEERNKLEGEVNLIERAKKLMANIAPPPSAVPNKGGEIAEPSIDIFSKCFDALIDIQRKIFVDAKRKPTTVADDDDILFSFILGIDQEKLFLKGLKPGIALPSAECAPFIFRTECTDQTLAEWIIPSNEELKAAGYVLPEPAPAPPAPAPAPAPVPDPKPAPAPPGPQASSLSITITSISSKAGAAEEAVEAIAQVTGLPVPEVRNQYNIEHLPKALPVTKCYNAATATFLTRNGITLTTAGFCTPQPQ